MRKRKIFAGLLIASAALGLVSCDKTDDTPADDTQQTTNYTVTFSGTSIANATTNNDGKVAKPTDPTKEGYTFGGWYTDQACTKEFDFNTVLTENITIYAKWTAVEAAPVTYTVTFSGAEVAAQTIENGSKATKPADPTKEGYTFEGWFTDEACTQAFSFDTAITSNTTLYAKWTAVEAAPVTYTVTFSGAEVAAQTIENGSKATKPTDPTKEGYTFEGWFTDEACTQAFSFDTAITSNTTLYAKWIEVKFTVTFSGAEVEEQIVKHSAKATEPTAPTKEDFIFGGWFTDEDCTQAFSFDTVITGDITLYAKWTEVKYIVTFNGSKVASQTIVKGEKAIEPAAPTKYGFTFDGWYADENYTEVYNFDTAITADVTIYAKWTELPLAEQENAIEMNGVAYETIADALAAIPTSGDTNTYTIRLNKGTYNENGLTYNGSATIKIVGNTHAEYGSDVIIKGHGSVMPGEQGSNTKSRCLISIQGTGNLILESVTLESDWYRSEHSGDVQAEVLGTDTSGNTAAYNCSFKSHQDTIRTIGKSWFYHCYIEGDVDFLWMEAGGKVALYEECEIVSVYDEYAKTHNTYITAPKMAETMKLGKGLVIYNSIVRESDEARANGQKTYLARTPWSSGCYNQVAYINTTCSDIELSDGPWYKNQIATVYEKTTVGWKMDQFTANSIGIQGSKDYILDADTVATEYSGRKAIINRFFDTGKLRYITDGSSNWDIDSFIEANGWSVTEDTSSDTLPNETMGEAVVYNFDGSVDQAAMCQGFEKENGKAHYRGQAGATITVPVTGKCYVEVYGYYAGVALATTDNQGAQVMFFNNGTTNSEVENDYIVYNADATSVVITASATTYITKIVVVSDSSIEYKAVEELTISKSSPLEIVGVPVTLSASIAPKGVTNASVKWTSSDEEVATIDEYTGKVSFLATGEVTFTATALDGSEVSQTITCNPTSPDWTVIEWYTTDNDIKVETGADGINMFDVNNSSYKGLSKQYTFTNLAGEEITTNCGFKLNSSGKLSFATLKYAEVTLIVAPQQNNNVTVPKITTADGATATLLSQSVDQETGLQTFTYALVESGLWNIERGDTTMENNPLVYASVEYATPIISEETGITFKGGSYTTGSTGLQNIVGSGFVDAEKRTIQINKMDITNCISNDTQGTNWLKFNASANAKIELNVARSCTLVVAYYSNPQKVTFDGTEIEYSINDKGLYEYEIPAGGLVTIEAIKNDFIGFVGVMFKTLDQRKEDACNKLDKTYPAKNYTQNAEYATVLQAQKDLINAAEDEASLKAALEAAIVVMDALEIDRVDLPEYADGYSYVFAEESAGLAAGATINSNMYITFTNCVNHDGTYIALKTDNSVAIKVAAGATLTVHMPYSSEITLNGEAYTLENDTLTYTATDNETVVITGKAGGAYITSIVVSPAPKYADGYSYVFSDVADDYGASAAIESNEYITFTNCVKHDGTYIALKTDNSVAIRVAAGATLTVHMPYSSEITLNGEAYTLENDTLTYTATDNETVVITGKAGGAYITSIVVSPAPKYADGYSYVFSDVAGDFGASAAIESNEYITFSNCVKHDGTYIALKTDNSVAIRVAAGATLTVHMPYSSEITLNGEAYTLENDTLTYTATANETVVITGKAGGAYITSIVVSPAPKYADGYSYVFSDVADDYGASAAIESNEYITFTNCVKHDGTYIALKTDNSVAIRVAAGATLTVHMPYSSEITLNGEAYTLENDTLTYTATANETVVITGKAGGAYITSIVVTPAPKYADNYSYVFANEADNYEASAAIESNEYITFTNCVKHDGTHIALKTDNSVAIRVAAGATLTVNMPYSSEITLNGEAYTLENNTLTYTATADETVVITGKAGGAYITSITVALTA